MSKEFKYDIVEQIAVLEESEKSNWCKLLSKISWNDNPPQYDIRSFDLSKPDSPRMGKGISLSDDAFIRLINTGLDLGIVSDETLEHVLKKRKKFFDKNGFLKKKYRKLKIKRID